MKRSVKYWDEFYLSIAKLYSTASKDPSTKVGAVITNNDNRIISTGYNGLPKKIKDSNSKLSSDIKLQMIIHAEVHAILHTTDDLTDKTIYVYPLLPCSTCASIIIQKGITRVVSVENLNVSDRWKQSIKIGMQLFKEAKVKVVTYPFF